MALLSSSHSLLFKATVTSSTAATASLYSFASSKLYPLAFPRRSYSPSPTISLFRSSKFNSPSSPRIPSSQKLTFSPIRSASAADIPDPSSDEALSGWNPSDQTINDDEESDKTQATFVDEWGERVELETEPLTRFSASDPPKEEDEWGGGGGRLAEDYVIPGNGSATAGERSDGKIEELKRCLVDTVYGTELGFSASAEVRGEVSELVAQLEGLNPTPAPTNDVVALEGNWVLLYTAFSELLPLLAAGTTPLLKVEKITQAINTSNLTLDNSVTFSSPFATFSFSASANFEVRSPSRIQVEFKEGTLQPPEIKSSISLPENVDIFGQKINLMPVQESLTPLQEAVASVARAISGQPPLKLPIPGERTKSWLLFTFVDKDLRISRGDGGLFVLAKAGSPLLD